ncbi:MAG: AAA family ATPase [Elusimicrobiota bacterium]|nr:AAA family ATPase [Elusimicrobiota bacterium]
MYEEYWNLTEKPFENTPDPKYFYRSSQHEEGLAGLIYVVREGKGAGLLTGIYGCGKTLLCRALMKELEQDVYKVALITNPRLDDVEMLRMIAYSLGAPELPTRKADVLIGLEQILKNNLSDGKKTVVIIDEAHVIEDRNIFEEIRLLLNFQFEDKFLLSLLLIGQPELKDKIENIKQLNQRIATRFHLGALTRKETAEYVLHRLKIALKEDRKIFTDDSLPFIYERSGGIPRRINQICDATLLIGYGKSAKIIDRELIKETIQSLNL